MGIVVPCVRDAASELRRIVAHDFTPLVGQRFEQHLDPLVERVFVPVLDLAFQAGRWSQSTSFGMAPFNVLMTFKYSPSSCTRTTWWRD